MEKKPQNKKQQLDLYKRTEVITSNRETLLLMMYSGALRFLRLAIDAITKKSVEDRHRFIRKTQDIVNELRANLNFEIGGDLAKNLDNLYEYVTHCLFEGNRQNEVKPLEDAYSVLKTLNDAWESAISSLKQKENLK